MEYIVLSMFQKNVETQYIRQKLMRIKISNGEIHNHVEAKTD